jgi:hypothetical protein
MLLFSKGNSLLIFQFDAKIPEDMLFPMVGEEFNIKQSPDKDMTR